MFITHEAINQAYKVEKQGSPVKIRFISPKCSAIRNSRPIKLIIQVYQVVSEKLDKPGLSTDKPGFSNHWAYINLV